MLDSILHDGAVQHPYYPLGANLPGYVPNTLSMPALISRFALACGIVFVTTSVVAKQIRPKITKRQLATTTWFVLCGCIHFFFEGYFAWNFDSMPSRTHLFGQLWKEYSLSDSRYLTLDAFVVTMEAVTAALWGPLSFVIAYCIVADHPLRHPLQLIVSLGQIYGDVLYYATFTFNEVVHGVNFCRPERFYFYMYYLFCNAFWIVIPLILLISSVKETTRVFALAKKMEAGKRDKKA